MTWARDADPRATARAAAGTLTVFVTVVMAQHILVPSLDPWRTTVSEYANGPHSELMTVGFVSWTLAFAFSAVASHRLEGSLNRALAWAFGAACVGGLLVTLFHTQAVYARIPVGESLRATGRLHDAGAALIALALSAGLVRAVGARELPRKVRSVSAVMMAVVLCDYAILLALGDPVPGLRQRIVIAVAVTWHALMLCHLKPASWLWRAVPSARHRGCARNTN